MHPSIRAGQRRWQALVDAWVSYIWTAGPHWTTPALRSLIRRLGIAVTLMTVLLPPIGYASLDLRGLQKRAAEHASLGARQVEVQLMKGRHDSWLNEVSINVLHAMRRGDSTIAASWLTDTNGAVVMFSGAPARWPEISKQCLHQGRRL